MIYDKTKIYIDTEEKRLFQQFEQSILTSHYIMGCVFLRKLIEKNIFEIYNENFSSLETSYRKANNKLIEHLKDKDETALLFLNEISKMHDELSSYIHYNNQERFKVEEINSIKLEEWIIKIENLIFLKKLFMSNEQNNFISFSENKNCTNVIENRNSYEFIRFFDLINTFSLRIPFYQRRFVWTIEQAYNFIVSDNLISELFLSFPKDNFNEKYVVDGQQRIKSLSIFMRYLLEKHNKILSEEEKNAILKNNTEITKNLHINNFFAYFDEHISDEKIIEIKDAVLNRLFLINNVDWSKQGSVFYSVNFSNTPLNSKEKSFAWMLSTMEMSEQEELISFLNLEAKKMFYGLYEDNEIINYTNYYLWINWSFVLDLINGKFSRNYLIDNKSATKQDINFFKTEAKKISALVRFFDVDDIFGGISLKLDKSDSESFSVVKKFIFDYESGLKHLSGADKNCARILFLTKVSLWDKITTTHLKDGNRTNDIQKEEDKIFGQKIMKLIYILVDVNDDKIYPSKFLKENYEIIWRFFSEFLIGVNSHTYGIMSFMPSFGLTQEDNEILKKLKESRTEGAMLLIDKIIEDKKFVESGEFKKVLDDFENYNREIEEEKIKSFCKDEHSMFQMGLDYIMEENEKDEEMFENNKKLNKLRASNDLELISFLNNYPKDVKWTSVNMNYEGVNISEWICLPDNNDFNHENTLINLKYIDVDFDTKNLDVNFKNNLNIYKKFNSYAEMLEKIKSEEFLEEIDKVMRDLLK